MDHTETDKPDEMVDGLLETQGEKLEPEFDGDGHVPHIGDMPEIVCGHFTVDVVCSDCGKAIIWREPRG